MESLIKQTRARFAGTGHENKEESSNTRDRRILPERTHPVREKRRSQSWIRRQFSSQMMSWDDRELSAEYPTAVAAAAYAVHQSLEESEYNMDNNYQKEKADSVVRRERKSSMRKIRNKEKDTRILPEPRQTSSYEPNPDETSRRSLRDPDIKVPINTSMSIKMPEETTDRGPAHESINRRLSFSNSDNETFWTPENPTPKRPPNAKRSSTSADKPLNIAEDNYKEPDQTTRKPKPDQPYPKMPVETIRKQNYATIPGPEDSMAAAWEKEEMASIKEQYEKLNDTIDKWEASKKRKARQTLQKKENDPSEKKREKALKNYYEDIARIESIAGGARAQAEENRRKEEYKVKEKANKIRSTGKIPNTCFCF